MAVTFTKKSALPKPVSAAAEGFKGVAAALSKLGKAMSGAATQASTTVASLRDAEALAEVGLGPTPTPIPKKAEKPVQSLPVAFCGTCGAPLPAPVPAIPLEEAVKTDVCLSFAEGDEVVITNTQHRWLERYRPGDTGVVKSCRIASEHEEARYTVTEVRLDKPRERGHDTVWLHLWELDKKRP